MKLFTVVPFLVSLVSLAFAQPAAERDLIRYSFNDTMEDSEAWRVYDYDGDGQAGGLNVFYPLTWTPKGGVGDSGYVWADDTRWRIDTPENPHSILALLVYQKWHTPRPNGKPGTYPRGFGQGIRDGYGPERIDIRNARLSVCLRGDNLRLKNAKVYFWVVTPEGYRWHFYGQPIALGEDYWGPKTEFVLKDDPSLWHLSFHGSDPVPKLADCLKKVVSYGFAFVGFKGEVTGKLSMDEFELKLAGSQL